MIDEYIPEVTEPSRIHKAGSTNSPTKLVLHMENIEKILMLPLDFHLGLFLPKSITVETQETGLHIRYQSQFLRSLYVNFTSRLGLHLNECLRNPVFFTLCSRTLCP